MSLAHRVRPRTGGARGVLGALIALAAVLALWPALAAAATAPAQIGFPASAPPAPGVNDYFKQFQVSVTNVGPASGAPDLWSPGAGWGFAQGVQLGHCVENDQFSQAGPGQVLSGADVSLPGDAASTAGRQRVKWLLLSSARSVAHPSPGLSADQEASAHQAAIWKLTNPADPIGHLPPADQGQDLTDPAALARAQALYDQVTAPGFDPAVVDRDPTVSVLGGTTACVGAERTVHLVGVPFTEATVTLTGPAAFTGPGEAQVRTVTLPADGVADLAITGTGPGTVQVSADMVKAEMFQAKNDTETTQRQDYVFPLFKHVTVTAELTVVECRLTLEATATPAFTRTFPWTIAKDASPRTQTVAGEVATVTYAVTVTKGAPADSGFKVTGTATLANSGPAPVGGVDVTAAVGATGCTVTGGSGATVPAGGTLPLPFTCTLAGPAADPLVVTATWAGGSASRSIALDFSTPTTVTGDTVTVTDTPAGLPTTVLGTVSATTTFPFSRQVAVPASGCATVLNTGAFATTDSPPATGQATASAEVCRTSPPGTLSPSGTPSGTPSGRTVKPVKRPRLAVEKRAPARATAGQVMPYTITVRNTGRAAARNLVLRDVLPGRVTLVRRAKGARIDEGAVSWRVGTLAPGRSRTVRLVVRLDTAAEGQTCNTARATASNAAPAQDRACTAVAPIANRVQPAVTG